MGTHPIFESDFDCLTEMHRLLSQPVRSLTLSAARGQHMSGFGKLKSNVGPVHRDVWSYRNALPYITAITCYWTYFCWHHAEHHMGTGPLGISLGLTLRKDHLMKLYFTNEELGLPKDMVTGSKANISPDTKMPLASDRTMPMQYYSTALSLGGAALLEMTNSIIYAVTGQESFAPVVSHDIKDLGASAVEAVADEDAEEEEEED